MKKTITTHRLQLTTETLRSLTSAELSTAAGGTDTLPTEIGFCQPSVPRQCNNSRACRQ